MKLQSESTFSISDICAVQFEKASYFSQQSWIHFIGVPILRRERNSEVGFFDSIDLVGFDRFTIH